MLNRKEIVLPPLPSDQDWLIDRGQVLGFRLDKKGICYGVAIAARNAILAGEFPVFIKRLYLINQYEKYDLLNQITTATSQFVELLEQIKKETPAMSDADLIETATNKLSTEEQMLLTINPFFEAVELYQQHYLHPHLFEETLKFSQNDVQVSDLILPVKLAEQGSIDQPGQFSSIFTQEEITLLLSTLRNEFGDAQIDSAIPLTLSSMDHSITLTFNSDGWTIMDPNHLPPQFLKIGEENLLAEKIMYAFSFVDPKKKGADLEKFIPFEASIHANKAQSSVVSKHIEAWLASNEMQNLLEITPAKAKRINSKGATWLTLALRMDDEKTALALLETNKARINEIYENATPIYLATSINSLPLMQKFIELGADVNSSNHLESDTLLLFAETKGLLNPIMALINSKNSGYTPKDTEGATPLHSAILSGNDDMVRLLLVKYATPKARLFNIKPEELALAFNLESIANSIIEYKKMIKHANELLRPVYAIASSSDAKKMEIIVQHMNERFLQREPIEAILASVEAEISVLQKEILAASELKNVSLFAQPSTSGRIEELDAEAKQMTDDLYGSDSEYESDDEETERKTNKPD